MVICTNCGAEFPELTAKSLEGLSPCPECMNCSLYEVPDPNNKAPVLTAGEPFYYEPPPAMIK